MPNHDDVDETQLTLFDEGAIAFDKGGGSIAIEVKSSGKWHVAKEASVDWINVSPTEASKGVTTLTIDVKTNHGVARESFITISTSKMDKIITVTQKGKDASTSDYCTIKTVRTMFVNREQEEWTIKEALKLKCVIISDRSAGNSLSPKSGFIQDEAGDGLAFSVTEASHSFDMGDRLIIDLEGATVSMYEGSMQVSFSSKVAKVESKNILVTPIELTIEDLIANDYDAILVKIKDVQFKTFKNLSYYEGKDKATHRIIENCNNANVFVTTYNNANFKDAPLPAGKGNVVGIVSLFEGIWRLVIRNLDDVKEMSNDESTRCTYETEPVNAAKISVAGFRAALIDDKTYTGNNYIEGEVILNPFKSNTPNDVVYIADETAGVVLSFSDKENILTNVPIGAKVKVNVKYTKAKVIHGLLQVGYANSLTTQEVEIVEKTSTTPLKPIVVTIDEVLDGKYQSQLVKIENVQFIDVEASYADNSFVINESNKEVRVYTNEDASFANDIVKEGMGSMVAVVSIENSPQLLIRSIEDLGHMVNKRFSVSYIVADKETIVLENENAQEIINITANVYWTASSDQSWLTVIPNDGLNNGFIIATANKNEGGERKGTISITDGVITKTIVVTQKARKINSNLATDLFFSEYVEGSSNNKYLEIYNGTGTTVDLSDYRIELYVNGQTKAKSTEILTGTLDNGKVVVFKHSAAAIYDGLATASSVINFNGNDAIALIKNSSDAYVDIFGSIGHDPGKGWTASYDVEVITMDRTLVRKPSVRNGVVTLPKKGFPTLGHEWIVYPIDTTDYLGSHTMD